ncbi:DUF885 family protein [Candidatus Viadribacter manganicus]|uniref:DUF885 domain-containing protein n=1 Tax=Candidatus Viadribacter manganicus TaxID=1759059 RepID=A0A1B1AJD6_9PROT|nr:DUF885 family protein [Candidatus Viadribacter manganicus]ANP46676.1 hypothetical protein ATE48_12495 [Candidatus Viadribacter manganicus]
MDRRSILLAGIGTLLASSAHADVVNSSGDFRSLAIALANADRRERAIQIAAFDKGTLSDEDRILYEAVAQGSWADGLIASSPWGRNGTPYVVTHRYGAYRSANPDAAAIDRETEELAAGAQAGAVAPVFVLDAAINAVDAASSRAHGSVAESMTRQISALRKVRDRSLEWITSGIRSADQGGLWTLPGGEDYYALSLQFQLGEEISPRAAHHRALTYCRSLQREVDALLRRQGLTRGGVGERLRTFALDERRLYSNDAAGKGQAVAEMNAALDRVRPLLRNVVAGADTQADVRLVPPEAEAGGAAGRREGTVYHVDFGAIRSRPRWTLPSVAFHELVPGHILQASSEREAPAPALQTRYASGYNEGWAIYAERLADEAGVYADDPASRIGYLQWMLFRFGRVVADTGIHVMRWSRERAIRELRELQGDGMAFVSIQEDVLRMCAQPGVAAAQGLTAMRIAEIRGRMRRGANGRFDARAFHAAMLLRGPLSPPGLAQAARVAFSL